MDTDVHDVETGLDFCGCIVMSNTEDPYKRGRYHVIEIKHVNFDAPATVCSSYEGFIQLVPVRTCAYTILAGLSGFYSYRDGISRVFREDESCRSRCAEAGYSYP